MKYIQNRKQNPKPELKTITVTVIKTETYSSPMPRTDSTQRVAHFPVTPASTALSEIFVVSDLLVKFYFLKSYAVRRKASILQQNLFMYMRGIPIISENFCFLPQSLRVFLLFQQRLCRVRCGLRWAGSHYLWGLLSVSRKYGS